MRSFLTDRNPTHEIARTSHYELWSGKCRCIIKFCFNKDYQLSSSCTGSSITSKSFLRLVSIRINSIYTRGCGSWRKGRFSVKLIKLNIKLNIFTNYHVSKVNKGKGMEVTKIITSKHPEILGVTGRCPGDMLPTFHVKMKYAGFEVAFHVISIFSLSVSICPVVIHPPVLFILNFSLFILCKNVLQTQSNYYLLLN